MKCKDEIHKGVQRRVNWLVKKSSDRRGLISTVCKSDFSTEEKLRKILMES
jgi:hypothetical protein